MASKLLARLPADYAIVKARETFAALQKRGLDPINLSIGEPELAPPARALDLLARCCSPEHASEHGRYPRIDGSVALRASFARFFERRCGVSLDPEREVLPLIGSKEGIVHLVLALADDEKPVYLPSVGYPVYESAARMAGAPIVSLGGTWEDGYRAVLPVAGGRGGVAVVGSPANPTGAVVPSADVAALVAAARAREIGVCFDAAYVELHGSAAAVKGPLALCGKDGVVELHSLSKTLGLPGWRIAFAVGDAAVLALLKRVKSFVDSGVPGPIQGAVAALLDDVAHVDAHIAAARATYVARHQSFREALRGLPLEVFASDAGLFAWVRASGTTSSGAALVAALEREAVVAVPGEAFGTAGAACARLTVSVPPDRLADVRRRIERALGHLTQA